MVDLNMDFSQSVIIETMLHFGCRRPCLVLKGVNWNDNMPSQAIQPL